MEKEDALAIMKKHLEKEPEHTRAETSPYGRRKNTFSDIKAKGYRYTRAYGEAPYHG